MIPRRISNWVAFLLATSWCCAPAAAGGPREAFKPEQVEFFEKRIRPLLVNHCYSCHSAKAPKLRAELYLDTRAGVRKGGVSGTAVVAGKPDESLLIKAVRYEQDADLQMPPKGKLAAAEIADLETWVKMGAPDPRDEASVTRKALAPSLEEAKKQWSLQPVRHPAPPAVKGARPRNPIDQFIRAVLETKGLQPAAPADPRTLLRRLSFDLIGLPPTPQEIAAFVEAWEAASANRQAILETTVDRLLASPAYGQRWGRHWLDVVRYADTAGDNSDYPIPQMIKYRDWVIDAFNRDMPYDQFVREQLAGDLMATKGSLDKIVATGYLANSRRHGSYEDKRYPWHLTIEDTIDNFGKAFLGATLACARCHDHKFDPFSAEDYYGLYGFFSSTRYPWPGIELDRQQRDLVPLGDPKEVERVSQARQRKVAEFDATVKQREADKTAAEKALRSAEGQARDDKQQADVVRLKNELEAANKALQAAKKERDRTARAPLPYETAYAMKDGPAAPQQRIGQVGNARVQLKGDPDYPGKEVPRRFPIVLGGQVLGTESKGSGRLELATWLTDPSNPRFARVMVNRIWQDHFGRGIIATPNDFGKQGQPPSHPELLDYLARRFIDGGWSIKALHRLIVTSATYQQSSSPTANNVSLGETVDPDNAYLSHFPRRRLDAEAIRDAILAVGGGLDRAPGGPHPFPEAPSWDFTQHKPFKAVYDSNCRSVYLMTQRIQRHPFLALFDGPDTNASTASRTTSTTPLQALYLMNDPFVHEQGRKFASRLLTERPDDASRIEHAFLLAFGRPPTSEEVPQALDYLAQVNVALQPAGLPAEQRLQRVWESLARVMFMSNEFVYVN